MDIDRSSQEQEKAQALPYSEQLIFELVYKLITIFIYVLLYTLKKRGVNGTKKW